MVFHCNPQNRTVLIENQGVGEHPNVEHMSFGPCSPSAKTKDDELFIQKSVRHTQGNAQDGENKIRWLRYTAEEDIFHKFFDLPWNRVIRYCRQQNIPLAEKEMVSYKSYGSS